MWPNTAIAMHQVTADIPPSFMDSYIAYGRYPLCFQAPEHTLHRGIVPTVSTTTHALAHAVTPEPLTKLPATILRSLIRVKQKIFRLAALLVSHIQRLDHQFCIRFPDSTRPTTRRA